MRDEVVLDASAVTDWLLPGPRSATALLTFANLRARRIAPDLIFAEFASVAVKFVRRGLVSTNDARDAVERLPQMIDEVMAMEGLAGPAFHLAARYGFPAYDAIYLALARQRDIPVVTADAKLARRAADLGLAGQVRLITSEP